MIGCCSAVRSPSIKSNTPPIPDRITPHRLNLECLNVKVSVAPGRPSLGGQRPVIGPVLQSREMNGSAGDIEIKNRN